MKKHFWFLAFAIAMGFGYGQGNPPKAPVLPESTHKLESEQLTKVANLLSKSSFEEASRLVKGVGIANPIRVYASWFTIPAEQREAFRNAARLAVENWNKALGGNPRIEWTDDEVSADVQVVFEEDVAEITGGQFRLMHGKAKLMLPPDKGERRRVRARIATYIPYTEMPMSEKAIAHLVGQAIGAYLGLGESQKDNEIMGPVWSTEDLPVAPAENEVQAVRALMEARNQLIDFANRRVAVYMPKPRIEIEPMEHDFGNIMQGEKVKFTFRIRNTGDAPLEINARPSCGCVVPQYDRVIQPGQEGKLDAEMNSAGFRGAQIKTIQVTSNDPDQPNLTLRLTAFIRTAVEVRPSETLQMSLKMGEPTVQEVEIVSNADQPLEVQEVIVNAPYAKAEAQKVDDKTTKILITVNPDAPTGRGNFIVMARTNLPSSPTVNINVMTEKGIVATPTTVFFGAIGSATPLPIERVVTLTRSYKGFQVKKFEVDDPNIEVKHESDPEGKQHRFILRYKGGWAQGTIRRTLRIETDDPQQAEIRVNLMANILPAGS